MRRFLWVLAALILALGPGCKDKQNEEDFSLLEEAFEVHEKSREKYKRLAQKRDSVRKKWKQYQVMEGIPPIADSLQRYDSLIGSWAETFTEVPGIQDYQEHHPDHNFGPSLIKDIAPARILEIQRIHHRELKALSAAYLQFADSFGPKEREANFTQQKSDK